MRLSKQMMTTACVVCLMSATAFLQAETLPDDTPQRIQRDRILVRPYQRVDGQLRHYRHAAGVSSQSLGTIPVVASRIGSPSVINLPGTAANNTRLANALSTASTQLSAMKNTSGAVYTLRQAQISQALDAIVESYVSSRHASSIPLSAMDDNDPFLGQMRDLKMGIMATDMDEATIDGLLSRLASAKALLTRLAETAQ